MRVVPWDGRTSNLDFRWNASAGMRVLGVEIGKRSNGLEFAVRVDQIVANSRTLQELCK